MEEFGQTDQSIAASEVSPLAKTSGSRQDSAVLCVFLDLLMRLSHVKMSHAKDKAASRSEQVFAFITLKA